MQRDDIYLKLFMAFFSECFMSSNFHKILFKIVIVIRISVN